MIVDNLNLEHVVAYASSVMAGFIPAIHGLLSVDEAKPWMPGTCPGMTAVVEIASRTL